MFEKFKVNHLFKGQVHERPHFSLRIQGHDYKGMVHGDKIHWYHPHPKQKHDEGFLDAVESKVFNMMKGHLVK
ncbi:hypothetical protein QNH39_16180 [Neobacillus novalis]|uniref:Uncharacterized protein n=1 Tax=Neobacillus novalis TaxID=220687 RepID=A0AA95MII1_9BACI|nr:hypothetical protein [Neobacillus novalis]WHY84200.1 hypothetical protein QNH39_16180 [Neobacillus novalis]